MGNLINLLGKTFDRLTVIEKTDKRTKSGNIYWKCRCVCGKIVVVCGSSLINHSTRSCGCLRIDVNKAMIRKKYNKYIFNTQYGTGYTNKNEPFYFDLEDYEKIKNYCWVINSCGYPVARDINNKKIIYLHRLILDANKTQGIDHINRIKIDNRKENLRFASQKYNSKNCKIPVNNTSGFIGVCWDKENKKWIAQIRSDGKNIKIGRYNNKEDAIINRLIAEKKYFKEFAPQRHLFKKYGI